MPATRKWLSQINWKEVSSKALLWANKFHGRYLQGIPSAPSPEDLVQGAIESLYSGRRTFKGDLAPSTVLINIMRSDASNFLTTRVGNKKYVPWDESGILAGSRKEKITKAEKRLLLVLCQETN